MANSFTFSVYLVSAAKQGSDATNTTGHSSGGVFVSRYVHMSIGRLWETGEEVVESLRVPQKERGHIAATTPQEEEQMESGGGESLEGRNRDHRTPASAFTQDVPGDNRQTQRSISE